jgi:hypothetical protein
MFMGWAKLLESKIVLALRINQSNSAYSCAAMHLSKQ